MTVRTAAGPAGALRGTDPHQENGTRTEKKTRGADQGQQPHRHHGVERPAGKRDEQPGRVLDAVHDAVHLRIIRFRHEIRDERYLGNGAEHIGAPYDQGDEIDGYQRHGRVAPSRKNRREQRVSSESDGIGTDEHLPDVAPVHNSAERQTQQQERQRLERRDDRKMNTGTGKVEHDKRQHESHQRTAEIVAYNGKQINPVIPLLDKFSM